MACQSLSAYVFDCGTTRVSGTRKMYIAAAKDVASVTVDGTSGMVSAIAMQDTLKFVNISIPKNTVNFGVGIEKNAENQTLSFTSEVSFPLNQYDNTTKKFVESIANQPVMVILELRNDNYVLLGKEGFLELSTLAGGSEAAAAGKLGFNITLTSSDSTLPHIIDSTIVSGVTA